MRSTDIHPRIFTATFWVLSVSLVLILARITRAAGDGEPPAVRPIGRRVTIKAPLGLPPVPIPPDNPPTAETIALGRRLFYEPGALCRWDHSLCVLPQSHAGICGQ